MPFGVDQPYWGECVYRLGVGPEPIPRNKLNVKRLSSAILQVITDQKLRNNALILGKKLSVEDGVGNAVEIIISYAGFLCKIIYMT